MDLVCPPTRVLSSTCVYRVGRETKVEGVRSNIEDQERRNVTKSEGASETSITPRAKTNPSTIYFYVVLCSPRPGE